MSRDLQRSRNMPGHLSRERFNLGNRRLSPLWESLGSGGSGRLPWDFQSRNQREVITSASRACGTKASVARRLPGDLRAACPQISSPCDTQRPETVGQRITITLLLNSTSQCTCSQTDLTSTQGGSDSGALGIPSRSREQCSRDKES